METCVTSGPFSKSPGKPWFTEVSTICNSDLKQGDTVLISFWARTVASKTEDGLGEFLIFFGVPADHPAGVTMMNLDFGYGLQTLEFAGIQVYQYADTTLDELPSTE